MLKIKKLQLHNYKGFIDVQFEFNNQLTCIAGINGAGKSTILEGLSKSLLAFLRPIYNKNLENVNYQDIKDSEINVNAENHYSKIVLNFVYDSNAYTQEINSNGESKKSFKSAVLGEKILKDMPIVAYYTVNRSEIDVDISVSEKDLSKKIEAVSGSLAATTHYKEFFQWFRDREDRENAVKLELYENESSNKKYEDKELKAVRNSFSVLLPNCSKMRVDSKRQSVIITKENETIDFNNMSDGEKGIITLFGDIARRLAIANENLENPLEGNGIILIDEIDLHLHPSWQRKVCKALKETFPNCQFVITTHSPQVLGELKTDEIWLLNDFNVYRPDSSYGLTSNEVLDEIMDIMEEDNSLSRDSEIAKKLNEVSMLVELEKFEEAKKIIDEIEKITGNEIHETAKYKTVIEMMGED